MVKFIYLIIFFIAFGCGVDRQYEDYALRSDDDLTLTQNNHPHGFGQNECFYCHVKANIHQVDRIKSPLFGLAKDLVEANGIDSCATCHGTNGR